VTAPLRQRNGEEQRATFLELFFDLVFVFAVTQVSHVLVEDLSLRGVGKALLLLLVVWWAWIYTAWMTNWFDPDAVRVRLVLIAAMTASLLMAIAIPKAFGEHGLLFASAYAGLQFVRNAFIVLATDRDVALRPTFVRIWAWSSWVGALWIAGGFLDGEARVAVWIVALVLDYAGPFVGYWTPGLGRSETTDWELEHAHFAERFHLFVIIALGETIVLTGLTASDLELTAARILAIVVALLNTAALWWLYFDEVAWRSRDDLETASDRGRVGRDAFTFLHLPIVAGILVVAVGDELVIAHPDEPLDGREVVALAVGPALYLLGHVAFRLRMRGTLATKRLAAAALAAGAAASALVVPPLVAWALVLAVLVLLATAETLARLRARPGEAREAEPA
jgi:low temperature requirement protein LtrA